MFIGTNYVPGTVLNKTVNIVFLHSRQKQVAASTNARGGHGE